MKTSNKLLLGLLIATIVLVTVNMLFTRSVIMKMMNNHTEPKIENIQ
jgi:hypothetical protein